MRWPIISNFMDGYNWKPWTPYRCAMSVRILRGVHNLFRLHYRGSGGSWSYGYDYVCGGCSMDVGPWTDKKLESTTKYINDLPSDKQQSVASYICMAKLD